MDLTECELLATCEFFQKYQTISETACKALISIYCKGPRKNECKRKEYRKEHGTPPKIDMMPNGKNLT
jgi:hypothetical protein